jgi:hypothetical protein
VTKPSAVFLHLLALTSVAISQPLFDILGRFPELLVAHRAGPGDVLLLAAVLYLGPALFLFALQRAGAAISAPLGIAIYLCAAGGAVSLFALLALARLPRLPVALTLAVALAAGVAGAVAVARWKTARSFLSVAGVLSLVFPLYFFLGSPVQRLLLAGHWAGAQTQAEQQALPPVVLVVFDELPLASLLTPEGEIDVQRFPAFGALAERATWYPRATSVASATQHAVPALLTGRYPGPGLLPSWVDQPENLFTLLAARYDLRAFETLTALCPPELCEEEGQPGALDRQRRLLGDLAVVQGHLLLPAKLAERLPPVTATWGHFRWRGPGPAKPELEHPEHSERFDAPGIVTRFVAGLTPSPRPVLHYLHLELPHIPWRYLPSGVEYGPVSGSFFAPGVEEDTTWRDDPWLIAQGLQRHLLQLGYVDRILGEILHRLEAAGLGEEALLVVTADHGLSFQAGEPGRILAPGNVHEVLSVPLFVRRPGQRSGERNELPAELVDILPTVAGALGIELPWEVDGLSLLDTETRLRGAKTFFDAETGRLDTLPVESFAAPQRRAVERISSLLPPGEGLDGLFRIGPHPGLLGRQLEDLGGLTLAATDVAITIDQPWLLHEVAPGSGFLPAHIEGTLRSPGHRGTRRGAPREPRELAVSINGVIRAVSRSYFVGDAERFAALVPEGSFVPGSNRVDVLLVGRDAAGRLELAMAEGLLGPRYELARDPRGEVTGIVASNSSSCSMSPESLTGELFRDGLTFEGWVVDLEEEVPSPVVLVFAGERLIYATAVGRPPPAGSMVPPGGRAARAGFLFGLTRPLLGPGDAEPRVFAVASERCAELLPETSGTG